MRTRSLRVSPITTSGSVLWKLYSSPARTFTCSTSPSMGARTASRSSWACACAAFASARQHPRPLKSHVFDAAAGLGRAQPRVGGPVRGLVGLRLPPRPLELVGRRRARLRQLLGAREDARRQLGAAPCAACASAATASLSSTRWPLQHPVQVRPLTRRGRPRPLSSCARSTLVVELHQQRRPSSPAGLLAPAPAAMTALTCAATFVSRSAGSTTPLPPTTTLAGAGSASRTSGPPTRDFASRSAFFSSFSTGTVTGAAVALRTICAPQLAQQQHEEDDANTAWNLVEHGGDSFRAAKARARGARLRCERCDRRSGRCGCRGSPPPRCDRARSTAS